jgi:hypothetical protein
MLMPVKQMALSVSRIGRRYWDVAYSTFRHEKNRFSFGFFHVKGYNYIFNWSPSLRAMSLPKTLARSQVSV